MAHENTVRPPKDRVSGSGKGISIPSDLGSAVVDEIVEQMNAAESQLNHSLLQIANAATTRRALGQFRYDVLIKDIAIHNIDNAAIANAATDIRLAYRAVGDKDLSVAGTPLPAAAGAMFIEGFNGATLAAGASAWGDQFKAGVLGVAVTKAFKSFILPKNNLLYIEVINTEGGAIDIAVTVTYAVHDGLNLQPRNIQNKVQQAARNFRRGDRRGVLA